MSRIDIQVKGLFATPVAAVVLPDAEGRNAELQEIILRRRAEHPTIGASNMGGWHSTRDFAEWGGKRAEEVLAFGRDMATKLTSNREGQSVRPEWKTEAWANAQRTWRFECLSLSSGVVWSGTYYVDDGGCADDPSLGGEFESSSARAGADDARARPEIRRRRRFVGRQRRDHSSASRV